MTSVTKPIRPNLRRGKQNETNRKQKVHAKLILLFVISFILSNLADVIITSTLLNDKD